MNDSFGGLFMLRVFLIFIMVYIIFTAIVLNYAKAYKAKDLIVAYLEDNNIADLNNMSVEAINDMEEYILSEVVGVVNYTYRGVATDCNSGNGDFCDFADYGIKISREYPNSNERNKLGVYYKVTTYYGFNLGFLRLFKSSGLNSDVDTTSDIFNIAIKGETRLIVGDGADVEGDDLS